MRHSECRVLIRHLPANRNGFVVLPRRDANTCDHPADDGRQRIELMRTIDFRKGFLFSAPNHANIVRVPLMRSGVVGVELERLLELSLSPRKIPVVLHLVAAQNGMRM